MTSTTENVAVLAARAGESLLRQVRSAVGSRMARSPEPGPASGWLAVTVQCEPGDIDLDRLPAPLAELGDRVEVRVHPAPGDKGTEVRARLRGASSGAAPIRLSGAGADGDLRSALRRAKQLVEVGEVLAVDPAPHGERTATPGGLLLEAWTRVAPRGGVR